MLEQQRHHVVQLLDTLNAFGDGQFFEDCNPITHLPETALESGQLQLIDLFGRHLLPVVQAMPDQGRRVVQQQVDLFFFCYCHGTVSGDSLVHALTVVAQRP
ncbi:hypothetical protein D3C81_1432270 [compost metagenome]